MKRIILLSGICALCIQSILAQEKMFVHRSDKITQGVLLSVLDSMTFVNEAVLLHLHDQDAPTYSMTEIDSLRRQLSANKNPLFRYRNRDC